MENKKNNDWQYLGEQYLANSISREDLEHLLQKMGKGEDAETLTAVLKDHWEKAKEQNNDNLPGWDAKFKILMNEVKEKAPVVQMQVMSRTNPLYRVAAAVIIILMLGAGSYYFFFNKNSKQEIAATDTAVQQYKNDLLPGTTGAILTLANGKQIILDSAGNGTLAMQGKTKLINKDGKIIYHGNGRIAEEVLYNTITTPRGRQYQLVLADGSKVWLNAASSIRYPATFAGKERKVEITGEAYFEVAPLSPPTGGGHGKLPFIVQINSPSGVDMGEIEVLGTHFNINSYEDETAIRTTLLEGLVKITKNNNTRMLSPGQQAQMNSSVSDGGIKILNAVDVDAVLAWKNGYFSFNNTDMATLMRQIARWYDVDIVYEGTIPERMFGGEISRNTNASQVLKILEESKVHFRIEGKKIIVQP